MSKFWTLLMVLASLVVLNTVPGAAGYWEPLVCNPKKKYSDPIEAAFDSLTCWNTNVSRAAICSVKNAVSGCYSKGNSPACVANQGNNNCHGNGALKCNDDEVDVRNFDGPAFCVPRVVKKNESNCRDSEGNPVDVATGEKFQSFTDWSSGGSLPLTLERHYSSDFRPRYAPIKTLLGDGWRTNFDAAAAYDFSAGVNSPATAVSGDMMHFVLPNGYAHSFKRNSTIWRLVLPRYLSGFSSNAWDAYRTDFDLSIVVSASGVELRHPDNTRYQFNNSGQLVEIRKSSGIVQKLIYSGSSLVEVRDSLGRWLRFRYDSDVTRDFLLKGVITFDGRQVKYEQINPATGQTTTSLPSTQRTSIGWTLRKVIYPDVTPAIDTDNPSHTFNYTFVGGLINTTVFVSVPNNYPLAEIIDEKGVQFAAWGYDPYGRVNTSYHAGSNDTFSFIYDDLNLKTTVINPLGRSTVYAYSKPANQAMRLMSVDGVATTNCVASNSSYLYDTNGFRSQVTDAEGRVTKWTRSTRGLATTTIEGFGTAEQKTVTTTWDATRPLPTQIAEPGRTTAIAYNTEAQVTQFTETDTTTTTVPYATSGQARTTMFNYATYTQPSGPVLGPTSAALTDVALPISNPDATIGTTAGWTNLVGAIGVRTIAPCAASACFFGGTTVDASAYQDIAIPVGQYTDVDSGKRAVQLQWMQAAYTATDDAAAMRIVFQNATGTVINSAASAPQIIKNWTQRILNHPVPPGTRTIRVFMVMQRSSGTNNDGYIDDIALKLVADGSAATHPFLSVVNGSAVAATTGWTVNGVNSSTTAPCTWQPCFQDTTTASDDMTQAIDIPADRIAEIDAGARSLELSWIDHSGDDITNIGVDVTFLNASSVALADGLRKIKPITLENIWTARTVPFDIPVGTRKVSIKMVFAQPADYPAASARFTGLTARLIAGSTPAASVKLLTSVDGPLAGTSDTVTYAYNSIGAVTSVTNEVGHVTTVTALTPNGLPSSITDPNGIVTTLTYNPRDWLTSVTVNPGASQAVTTIAYDAIGQVTRVTEPDGAYLDYVWNDARRLSSVTNNTGEKIEYAYNVNGDMTSSTVKTSSNTVTKQMTMVYDELGRVLRSIGAANQTTEMAYDRTDLTTQVKDPRNNVYGYSYDGLQRLIRSTDQVGAQLNVTRNGQDDVTAYQDPRSITTSYVLNGFGEVIQEVSPDAGTTTFTRDARGLVTSETDGRGVVTNRTYDNAGRMLTESYPADAAENVTYTYDNITAGNKGKGRLTGITDQSGSIAYVYDALGRVITDTRVMATKTYVTSYQYNAADRVTQITYPSGRIVDITRNSLGQVTGVTTKQNATAAVVTVVSGVTYQPLSELVKTMTHGNGLITKAGYDLDSRLSSLTVKDGPTNVSSLVYAYSDGLNLTGMTDQVTAANSNTLWYTAANRLQNANGPWGETENYYDVVGNRTYNINTVGATATTRVQSYGSTNNRLNTITENTAAWRSYTYDGSGNTLTETRPGESFAYTYNKRNRLVGVTRNTASFASYTYNALEQLTTRTSSAPAAPVGQVAYTYDNDNHLLTEAAATTGAKTREYIWLPSNDNDPIDLPLAVIDVATNTLTHVHADHLGRPTRMTDAAKSTVWQATWTPWGEAHSISGTVQNNLRYPGQYFQIETGLHYNHHRNYDPITGRYTQPDPLRFVDGPSVYAYAGNSPYMNTDREGRCFWDGCVVEAIVVGAVVGIVIEYALNGECATWKDYALAGGLGALPGGAAVKGLKAYKYFSNLRKAKKRYPKLAGLYQKHHNHPKYLGGAANGPLTGLNGAYHQLITNAFRARAAYGKSGVLKPAESARIMKDVYRQLPLSWW